MRLVYIEYVLCLFCALLMVAINSEKSCGQEWFGENCQYKCRCGNNSCDKNGLCTGVQTCLGGWFGPGCQYVDLGFKTGDVVKVTDGNDSTCLAGIDGESATFPFQRPIIFSWLRYIVSEPGLLNEMQVTLKHTGTATTCTNERHVVVDNNTMDIHCDVYDPIDVVTLTGDGIHFLCSVCISGGRNIALKAEAEQSSTYSELSGSTFQLNISFTASKAVDGKNNQFMYDSFSCSQTLANPNAREYWRVSFPNRHNVTRYIIYHRIDGDEARLTNYTLESISLDGKPVFNYTDTGKGDTLGVVTLVHSPSTIAQVYIYGITFPKRITLCEVEIYGDSICDPGKHGPECEFTCQCLNTTCVSTTGGCPGEIKPMIGHNNISCPPGTYGPGCIRNCSKFCARDKAGVMSCKSSNGTCNYGCTSGYMGATCKQKCGTGTYGKGCSSTCSPQCLPSNDTTASSCDHVTGVCLFACQDGATGPMCSPETEESIREQTGDAGRSYTGYIIGLFLVLVLLLTLGYCLRKKKPAKSPPLVEEKAHH